MCIDLVKARTWLRSLNTTAKCGTFLLRHISPFRISHPPNFPPSRTCSAVCTVAVKGTAHQPRFEIPTEPPPGGKSGPELARNIDVGTVVHGALQGDKHEDFTMASVDP